MLATFRETIKSLQDKTYGGEIVKKSLGQVIWYWTKYLLLFALIPLVLIIGSLTYSVPQLPNTLRNQLPEFVGGIKDGKFFTKNTEPLRFQDPNFLFILDPTASESDLASVSAGIVISQDQMFFKDNGTTRSQDYSDIPDFEIAKSGLTDWVSTHQSLIWVILVSATILLGLLLVIFYWVYRFVTFWIWAAVVWALARILKKTLVYTDAFKIVIYASILPLLISAVLFVAPSDVMGLIGFGVFAFFTVSWIINLKQSSIKEA